MKSQRNNFLIHKDFVNLIFFLCFVFGAVEKCYPYEYMHDCEKFNETSFHEKKRFTVT